MIFSLFRWVKIPGTELLPGDIVSIGRSASGEDKSVPADMLLLAGSAIVNEAILTGESTPQWKVLFSSLYDSIKSKISLDLDKYLQSYYF
jgi:manganese-transporting P-type ATPase